MTDRVNYLTVVLDRDYRTDDVKHVVDAISMIKGVISVNINVATPDEYMAEARAKRELIDKIIELLK